MPTQLFGNVLVFQHQPDYNDLALSTLQRLEYFESPGTDAKIEHFFKNALISARFNPERTIFLNPMYTVTTSRPSEEFFRQARRVQRSWIAELKKFLGRELRTYVRGLSPLMRQLTFSGVLIVAGKHHRPDQWPQLIRSPSGAYQLLGKVFGRLTVIERLPKGRWKCRCQCGQEHTVRTKHLVNENIKSCGCLKAEIDRRRQDRRLQRAWFKSGIFRPHET